MGEKQEIRQDDKADAPSSSLRALYERYRKELAVFARRRTGGGPPDPDDVVQQVFANVSAMEDLAALKNPRAFLYRAAANLITDFHRRAEHKRNVDAADEDLDDLMEDCDEISPEIVILSRERFNSVDAALRTLPRRQRRFLLLNRINGLSYTEIARRNGISVTTVRRDVETAVRACRKAVEHLDNDGK